MRILRSLLALLLFLPAMAAAHETEGARWSIAIHGGAGTMDRERMTAEQRAAYEAALQAALDAGAEVLRNGGSAMDAVKAAIVPMEDDPKFNAGRGAVFTWEGANELDASIMDGRDRSAGAVTGVRTVRHPILLADAVRTGSPHVFLSGAGAEEFAQDRDLEIVPPEWFQTDARREALERMKARAVSAYDVDGKFGTVGAVALDMHGNLAAGTSTGGMTGKRWGRIGDSPVIGAGTYADNRACAVSATGSGEYFIRVGVAHEICTRMRMAARMALEDMVMALPEGGEDGEGDVAATNVPLTGEIVQSIADAVMAEVGALGGEGGVIVVSPSGEAIFSFDTPGMYRGRATSEGVNEVAIFAGE